MASSTDEILIVEVAVRQVITEILSTAFGKDWISRCGIDENQIKLWRSRQAKEQRERPYASPERPLFDYAQITQLYPIMERHWDLLEPCLLDRERTLFYLRRLEPLRNTLMHGRRLLKHECDLVAGICGELRSVVTKYKTHHAGEFYARIEQIVDSFGNSTPALNKDFGLASKNVSRCNELLRIGDIVNFTATAFDPEDLEVEWQLDVQRTEVPFDHSAFANPTSGYNVSLEWRVSDNDVGESIWVAVFLRAKADHLRYGSYDDLAFYQYRVAPPSGRRRMRA